MNSIVTRNQKHRRLTNTKKKRTQNPTEENHQTTEGKTKRRKGKRRNTYIINWKTRVKMVINIYPSIITLNFRGLNALIKRYRDWIKKKNVQYHAHQFSAKDPH